MTALKWITTEAKKLKKKYPNKEWKQLVAQASAIYASKHKGKSPIGKKRKKVSGVKKAAPKKRVVKKKAAPKSYHKDTKSHNVRISVVSGVNMQMFKILQDETRLLKRQETDLADMETIRKHDKNHPYASLERIKHKKDLIKNTKKRIAKIKRAL